MTDLPYCDWGQSAIITIKKANLPINRNIVAGTLGGGMYVVMSKCKGLLTELSINSGYMCNTS